MEQDAPEWAISIWLIAVREAVAPDEARRYWDVKETPILDELLARSPALRLGTTEVALPENVNRRGPVGRVVELLSFRGTMPGYDLPMVDRDLRAELVDCILPQATDPPFDVISAEELSEFLTEHEGEWLAIRSRLAGNSCGSSSASPFTCP